jgi:hypothetical protein
MAGFLLGAWAALLPVAAGGGSAMGLSRESVGKEVCVVGKISQIPWQHMIRPDLGKDAQYIDLEEGGQIVAYMRGMSSCAQPLLLEGKVLLTEGESKRPGSKERTSELQLDVSRWTCLNAGGSKRLLARLGDPAESREAKEGIELGLVAAGKEAIPQLIEHLGDSRVCWTERVLLNEGSLMNRPPNAPPIQEEWTDAKVTVGERSEALLTRIVWPVGYKSPFAGNFKTVSRGSPPFRVEDWRAWWAKNKAKPLDEIREGMKPVLDAYWKSKGVQQVVR